MNIFVILKKAFRINAHGQDWVQIQISKLKINCSKLNLDDLVKMRNLVILQLFISQFIVQLKIMYQLQETNFTNRSNQPFLAQQLQQEGPVKQRSCTDIVCLILFLGFIGAFIAILIYALVAGTPKKVINVHNAAGVICYEQPGFQYGYFPIPGQTKNAMCVSSCPKMGQAVQCLQDNVFCQTGTYTAPDLYSTFPILNYCVPDPKFRGNAVTQYFDYNVIVQWVFDIDDGWPIIAGSAGAALIVVILYACLMRCLTGCILYTALAVIQIAMLGIGCLLIMEGSNNVPFTKMLPINLARLSQLELYISGGILIVLALIFLIVIICICPQLHLGVKIVETAAMFISERFYMAAMPIISMIFFFATIAAVLAGGVYIYGTGERMVIAPNSFATVNFTWQLITLFSVFGFAGFWMICWIFYSNTFIVMSGAAIWYYQQDSPLCTSFHRLLRYHTGSLAFASLLFGVLFILRLVAKFFHLRNEESENKCIRVCISITTACLVVFDQILKFLSEGVFVQIAMKSTNYCESTIQSFKLLVSNPLKIAITGVISYMVAILGILFSTAVICTAAYFIQVYVPYFSSILTNPIPITVISGFAVVIVSGIYMSILADSAESIIQCYLIQETEAREKGRRAKFAPQHLKAILQGHISD